MSIVTEHRLDFEIAPAAGDYFSKQGYTHFRVGTVKGLYGTDRKGYFLLAILNQQPGNGHFRDTLQWFEHSCKRDKTNLRIIEIMNSGFKKALIERYGFQHEGDDSVIKKFEQQT